MDNGELIQKLFVVKETFPNLDWHVQGSSNPSLVIAVDITAENAEFLDAARRMFEPA